MKIVLLQSAEVLPPFSTSEHSLINVEVDAKPKASPDVPFLRTNFRSTKADWNNFRSYIAEAHLSALLKKIELPKVAPSFLNGDFLKSKVLSHMKK